MCDYVLRTKLLTKRYRKQTVLSNVNVNIKKGDVYGFIGQNGAGKTSLIRIITGLSFQSEGTLELFGETESKNINLNRKKLGCIIESPSLYLNMTAKQNLDIITTERGIRDKKCIDSVLKTVKLDDIYEKKVKNFSLGMKQKLALAIALINKPEFLILDEPLNGLDPTSIIEFRDLIKNLNKDFGTTILISSHLLSELHQVATKFGFIHHGKIFEEISSKELDLRCSSYINLVVDNLSKAINILDKKLKFRYEVLEKNTIKIHENSDNIKSIIKEFSLENVGIENIDTKSDDLEKYFIDLIRRAT